MYRDSYTKCLGCDAEMELAGVADCRFRRCVDCGGGWVSYAALTRMFAAMRWDAKVEMRQAATSTGRLTFDVFRGDTLVERVGFDREIIKIGKLQSSHLRLDDEMVSRMHAVIENREDDDIQIIDLGSSVGTFVNGKRVNKAVIRDGDFVYIGPFKLVASLGVPPVGDSRLCPECREALKPMRIDTILVDVCDEHGVWFDRTELERVLLRASQD